MVKKKNDKSVSEARRTNILLEEMRTDIKRIAENQDANNDKIAKIDGIASDLSELKSEVAVIKLTVTNNSKEIKGLKSEVETIKMAVMDDSRETKQHGQRITKLEEKILT
jgi:outer membrane murein-binding lipoprotein Lpp